MPFSSSAKKRLRFSRVVEPEAPIRAELFSIERLEQHARSLAAEQKIAHAFSLGHPLLDRVKDNARALTAGYHAIASAVREERATSPAAQWLVDNFHIVEEQIREIIDDLPPGFYRKLPKLTDGFLAGHPRVYALAWAFVAHTDSRFDPEWLRRFVRAYQQESPLRIGEIWALAISLRIVLVENLRRLTDRLLAGKTARHEANSLADALLGLGGQPESPVDDALQTFESLPVRRAFAMQLVQRLRELGGSAEKALRWLDERLRKQETTAENIVREEHQEQTALNTTVRNVILSMRVISAFDWAEFFEEVSAVDAILCAKSDFASLDFATRDFYRHAIEDLSRGSGVSEIDVARRVAEEAASARAAGGAASADEAEIARKSDPGYYLIAKGRRRFEKKLRYGVPLLQRFLRAYTSWAAVTYLGSVAVVTGLALGFILQSSRNAGAHGWALTAMALLAIPAASDVAVALVNRFVTELVGPKLLPKLDFSKGIPERCPTLVVMPTLLSNKDAIQDLLERVEIHYLGNADGRVQFALLTDWMDSPMEQAVGDDALLELAVKGIDRLNRKHGADAEGRPRFFLLHRRRRWNPAENVWMGWERKRGKLAELNRLLRGGTDTTFVVRADDEHAVPQGIRYVITLDSDTRLGRGAIHRLVGAMAHPLNHPRLDPVSRRIVDGYAIMQPRITPTLPSSGSESLYQEIYSGPAGIDPYAFAVSDVYQDLFKEGSYIGKGIYDVDAFDAALAHRVPDNTLLSHDLFEGLFARAALVTDIEFYEEFPSHYEVAVGRSHRWVRGDWQLLPWILKPLSAIGRWKMLDNLRRSLLAPTTFLALLLAWTITEIPARLWTGFFLATMAIPPFLSVVAELWPRRRQTPFLSHARMLMLDARIALWQFVLPIVFLAHQAWVMIDAIIRTLYRVFLSHRRLLEWTSAAHATQAMRSVEGSSYRRMAAAPLVAFLAGGTAALNASHVPWGVAAPILFLWFVSPWVAQTISRVESWEGGHPVTREEQRYLRGVARKTWRFFQTFVNAENHFLPPDNFQEIPRPVVASRTSPTNIGLSLLSVVAAREFGWLGLDDAIQRLEATLETIRQLKKYRGHLYNWYDTRDLRPLEPLYVSTVDSGNLAGHLWAVGNACRRWALASALSPELSQGIIDVLDLIETGSKNVDDKNRVGVATSAQMRETLATLRNSASAPIANDGAVRVTELKAGATALIDIIQALGVTESSEDVNADVLSWARLLLEQVESHARDGHDAPIGSRPPAGVAQRLRLLANLCDELVSQMKFGFLLDPIKKIFSIGFQVAEEKFDPSYYDLLASEARLASFVAIAKGDVPTSHWFRLGRFLAHVDHGLVLLSWSGSMFEYLMPALVMHTPLNGLLDETYRRVVRRQIEYGKERGVPWGISEAAYNTQNLDFAYQYSNFGVPGLGLKHGLSEDLVIAPYATALAAMIDPSAAVKNFHALAALGADGRFGFYESLDFTPARLPEDQKVAVVRAYMAHHQGMSLVSFLNVLKSGVARDLFHAEPMVQASDLLLQERTPRNIPTARVRVDDVQGDVRESTPALLRRFFSPHDVIPRTHLLSNGRYSVMMTAAGSGYSRCKDMAVTRWREDSTRDPWGTFIFLRDVESGQVWSAGYQPSGAEPERYEVDFSEDRAEIVRHDGSLITTLEVVVSPEDDAEIRRVSIKNTGGATHEIEITSYAEIVLAPPAADLAHPAFSNLFVQTEFVADVNGLLCHRRPRAPGDPDRWAAHVVVVEGETLGALQYESDRARFLGRGRGVRTPMCVIDGKPLSDTAGPVLDPVVSLRRRIRLKPGETARVAFTTLIAATREEAKNLADKYHDPAMFERTVTLAWTQAQVQLHYLGLETGEAHLFQDLASRVLYSHAALRPPSDFLKKNARGQSGLWAHGISGDLPIVLVSIDDVDDTNLVRSLLRAHEYWRMKELAVDLIILNERGASYVQDLQNALENLVRLSQSAVRHESHNPHGGIYVLRTDQLASEDRVLLMAAARVVLLARHGSLAQQMERLEGMTAPASSAGLQRRTPTENTITPKGPPRDLQFFNGLGGFSEDGADYVTVLGVGQWTPAPWVNVIANPQFGFQVSECGAGSTWSVNSRENQLTPWSNDPVSDSTGETFYIRDEETGALWTPTALPIREETSSYIARHGQGYSRFEHASHGIEVDLLQFVPVDDPIKISRLTISNRSTQKRKLSVTAYVEWVLGTSRSASAPFIVTDVDKETGALFASNPWNTEFGGRVAFADFGGRQQTWTADRTEFLGRNGTPDHPVALERNRRFSGKTGAGLDPCAALQTVLQLNPGATIELVFTLGQGANREEAVTLIKRYRSTPSAVALAAVRTRWSDVNGAVTVRTPEKSMDILLNHWLLYQTLSCRLWARAGFYQAGGAYGFRDQLQDILPLIVTRRDLAREHILRAAARQFPEGDVQHWWHPPSGRGVRTRISDDLVWLPYTLLHYLETTGDVGILDESIPFLESQPIPAGREDFYFVPTPTAERATLFEHCARALDRSLPVGAHGLPFMGTGDWNDGMNRVGAEGKGESVWLAWFLHTVLWEFAKRADARGESERAEKWRLHVGELKTAVERNGWDGEWYRRAYFDDGTPVGAAANAECQIDSIAQSWGVLSGAADPARASRAMAAAYDKLFKREDRMMLLFTPPFNQSQPSPGYIQGYLPGVRENGGQYTHAAVWSVLAFAALGDGDKAGELFSSLNPINHGLSRTDIHRYKVEPYVVAGDVYADAPHTGRGGWTWYTGSAGWMYRAGIEWILGFRLREKTLLMDPCIPRAWPGYEILFRYHSSRYEVTVENPRGVMRGVQSAEMDGKPIRAADPILLADDGQVHRIRIVLGA